MRRRVERSRGSGGPRVCSRSIQESSSSSKHADQSPSLSRFIRTRRFKDVDYLAEQALKFTSLSWRSTLPAGTPVTIFYSERIAELLGRLKDVPDWSSAPLSVKLKWSRWFL